MIAVAAVSVVGALFMATRAVKMPTQRLGELSMQTAKEGEPIPIIWGTAPPIAGNLVAVQEPPRIERRKQKSGGKGGGGSSQKVEIPRRTYAMGICEGPNVKLRRAWRNAKLVYDGRSGSDWGARNNGTFLQRFRVYPGSFTQLPDADLEAVFGVGNVPAMRGLAYMVALDEDLQDTGGAVPQWQFEVVRAEGLYLTSWVYPIEVIESGQSTGGTAAGGNLPYSDDADSTGGAVLSGSFVSTLLELDLGPESADAGSGAVLSGEFRSLLESYSRYIPEMVDSAGGAVGGGDLRLALISYENYEAEALESNGGLVNGGSLND